MNITKIPTTAKFTVCRQLCNYIPNHLVPKLARGRESPTIGGRVQPGAVA